jgi:co-chaperonin GroES (HSP10)
MTVSASASLRQIAEESGSDPRGAMLRVLGDYSHFIAIAPHRVLVQIYVQPEQTQGGVYLPDKTLAEDRFQGKVGLVLKVGQMAFSDKEWFGDFKVQAGDWIFANPSDGWELFHVENRQGVPLRSYADTSILGITTSPEKIY